MNEEKKKKSDGVLKETFKLPTANQLRQYVKEKKHVWTDLDRIVAPSVLLLNDVLTLHASNNTLLKLYASKEEINAAKEAARKRIECLDDILVKLKQSSFDYNVALMSPPWDQDENGFDSIGVSSIEKYKNVVNTLTKTLWTDGVPFNNYCKVSGTKKRAKAGCAAIATGQIFAYYKYPAKYNGHDYLWNEILSGEKQPTTEKGKTAVAYLISDIGRLDKTRYGVSSSATNVTNVKNALNTMGYNYTYEQNPLSFVIYVNVLRSHPVLISATEKSKKTGHMWVIDGYADGVYYIEYYNYNTGESARKEKTLPLVHCNWGWGGQGNGYYLFNVFDMQYSDPHKTRATYNSNISAYVNISPKK